MFKFPANEYISVVRGGEGGGPEGERGEKVYATSRKIFKYFSKFIFNIFFFLDFFATLS